MNPQDLLVHIIRPTINLLGMHSTQAEVLLLATAAMESDCGKYLVQRGGGPALGIYQMEPATHADLWNKYIVRKYAIEKHLKYTKIPGWDGLTQLKVNPVYATAMARIQYYRRPEKLPEIDKVSMWKYYKQFYNTPLGKSDPITWGEKWDKYVVLVL